MFAHSTTLISQFVHFISKKRRLWIAKIIFTRSSLSFSSVNGSFSITYIMLSFLLQSYKIAELQPLRISDYLL